MGKIVDPSMEKEEPLKTLNIPTEKNLDMSTPFKVADIDDIFDTLYEPVDDNSFDSEATHVKETDKLSSEFCPGGDLEICTDDCDFEDTRTHRICIELCANKCLDKKYSYVIV